jgi:Holliday junction DNA helicase RuvA
MIRQITGIISNINQNNSELTIVNNGIGFAVKSNLKTLCLVKRNQEATLQVSMLVKEDGISLYGFLEQAQREIFEKVIKVSGIGPKSALSILEILTVNDFVAAVIKEDVKLIASAQGIGLKTAQRLILELKTSFKKLSFAKNDNNEDFHSREEVYAILSELGFSLQDLNQKLKQAQKENLADDVETLVRFCLATGKA